MFRQRKKLVVTLGATVAAILVSATAAYATLGPGVTVTAALKGGTVMTFAGNINSVPITVSCTSFSGSGTTGSSPSDSVPLTGSPTISGCTDSTGGSDTITTNTTNGQWVLSVTSKKPYKATLTIPKAGATFASNILPGCTITAAPTKAAQVKGSFDGNNTDTVKNAKIKTKGSGCTSTTAKTNATVVLSPAPGPPPYG
ncbi:MAG TPA: hypothetical protein VN796_08270 [Acidimicrobiales bacterium]|nr:hypothetical protein [Acidimicrobiales bacterium]